MKKRSPIVRFMSLVVTVLFVFSITPQWVWHDQFSHHIDSVHQHKDCSADDLVSYHRFCHVQDWVVGTPFIEIKSASPAPLPGVFQMPDGQYPAVFQPVFKADFNRRGPPSHLV